MATVPHRRSSIARGSRLRFGAALALAFCPSLLVGCGSDVTVNGKSVASFTGGALAGAVDNPLACTADGQVGCLTTPSFPAASTAGLAPKIVAGNKVAGVVGTGSGGTTPPAPCTADGQGACIVDGTAYKAAKAANFTSDSIVAGTTIAGVAGTLTLPSASEVLSGVQFGGSGNRQSGTLAPPSLTLPPASFVLASAGTFGAGGTGQTPTLTLPGVSSVQAGTTFGVAGVGSTGTFAAAANCTSDNQAGCITTSRFKAADTTAVAATDLRSGKTLAGISGTLKANCRNAVNSTLYNFDGPVASLDNNDDTSGTVDDIWDTIDDLTSFPTGQVVGWTAGNYCDSTNWTDVTPGGGCSANVASCMYTDDTSGLTVTPSIAASDPWNAAVQACSASTYGGQAAGAWRLPTQKELMQLYTDGIVALASASYMTPATMENNFWSASTDSESPTSAWAMTLASGMTSNQTKVTDAFVLCVRP